MKKTLVLLAAAVVLLGLALYLHQRENAPTRPAAPAAATQSGEGAGLLRGQLLAGDLGERLDEVQRIELRREGEPPVLLERRGPEEWVLASADGYPADPGKVARLALAAAQLKALDVITRNAEKHELFGLEADAPEWGSLRLLDASGAPLAEIALGQQREAAQTGTPGAPVSQGRYARRMDDPSVYLTDAELFWAGARTTNWVNAELLALQASDITAIQLDNVGTRTVTLNWEGSLVKAEPLPEGHQVKRGEANSLRSSLSSLRFEDVAAADTPTSPPLDVQTTLTATTRFGEVYSLRLAPGENGKEYLRIGLEMLDAPQPTAADEASTESLAAWQAGVEAAREALPEKREALEPWRFELPSWSASRLTKKPAELIERAEPIPALEPEAGQSETPGTGQ